MFGLLAPNGAGKTTTISLMIGLLKPDQGAVQVVGLDMARAPLEAKRKIGFVPQELALYPTLSAFEGVEELNEAGVTVLNTTHYMEEAERLCDRIAIMDRGRIMALDALAALLAIVLAAGGGVFTPVFAMLDFMQRLSRLAPHAWALAGYQDIIVRGLGVGAAVDEVPPLLMFAVVFFGIAVRQFRFEV